MNDNERIVAVVVALNTPIAAQYTVDAAGYSLGATAWSALFFAGAAVAAGVMWLDGRKYGTYGLALLAPVAPLFLLAGGEASTSVFLACMGLLGLGLSLVCYDSYRLVQRKQKRTVTPPATR
ncbi:hypothetical protein AUR64_17050 [Haloprofundus marisrubri]|uniref:Uncharacterized protein n=1 Tax=Haloprofundus marisrubri TaxID=1514971 RepID=A0A0W1R7U4_9EURY|nr:hypothetical protein [Haloprofundus marisrubri]KTG09480.1 hypothetical protein AUR64_17050 [Haloprofundus marisrubri]